MMPLISQYFVHVQGSASACGWLQAPGVSQIGKGEHRTQAFLLRIRGFARFAAVGTVFCAGAFFEIQRKHSGMSCCLLDELLMLLLMWCLDCMRCVVVAVLRLTHRYNAVRAHRTGSKNSGVRDYLRRKTNTNTMWLYVVPQPNMEVSRSTVDSRQINFNKWTQQA